MSFARNLAAALLILGAGVASAQCPEPLEPEIPDGATAALQDMMMAQQDIKAYQLDAEAYRECLGKSNSKAYNRSVDREEELAAEFNKQIKAFRAANPS